MIIYLVLGIIAGTIAGLIPGLHTNTISKALLFTPLFGFEAIIFVLSMGTVQSFVDFIPSIFIGASDSSTFESVLPGHKMFLEGDAFTAINLTIIGGIIATIVSLLFMPIFIHFIEVNQELFPKMIPLILIFSILILIFSNPSNKIKIFTAFIIFASATQGFLFQNQIFPLITGYFGIATLLISSKKETKVKQKHTTNIDTNYLPGVIGVIGGGIVSIVPGIGNNLAARIVRIFINKINSKEYLLLLGSINTSNFIFSFPVLLFLNKARNGMMIILKEKIIFDYDSLIIGIITILISTGIGGIITLFLAKNIIKIEFNKQKLEVFGIIFMTFLVILFNGLFGFVALFFASVLGILTIKLNVTRSSCLGFLIIPTLFFYISLLF